MIIEYCKSSDLSQIKLISDQKFGFNYLSETDLQDYFNSEISTFVVARDKGKLVGFSLFNLGNFKETLNEIGPEYYKLLSPLEKYEIIQLRKTTAVHDDFLKRGIGSLLVEYAVTQKKADLYLSLVWKRVVQVPVIEIITKLGFKEFCEIDNYWNKDSLMKVYNCPECGKPPCTCSLVILTRKG